MNKKDLQNIKNGLPKLDLPRYSHKLFGLNKTVKFRVFNVKEQKILLQAKEDDSVKSQSDAIKQLVDLCTFGQVDAGSLPYFDLEDLFLQTRIRSVSDTSMIQYEFTGEEEKKTPIDVNIDLKQAKVISPEGHDKKLMFNEEIGVIMRYPTLDLMIEVEDQMEMIDYCIEFVFTKDETFKFTEFTKEERTDWIEGLGVSELIKIKEFFDSMPKLYLEKEIDLPDGTKHTLKFEGLQSFFS